MPMEKKLISIDWLELYTHNTDKELQDGYPKVERGDFTLILREVGNRYFANIYDIEYKGQLWACLTLTPRAKFINKKVALLKIHNRLLYNDRWYDNTMAIVQALGLKIKGITRLDVCYDCLRFKNGYRPHKFIKDFVSKDCEDNGYIHRYGSNTFQIVGTKKPNERSKYSYISFGARTSCVRAYIYNKSKELREVNDKPWIRDCWERAGLMTDKEDVWRTEISIKSEGLRVVDIATGEIFNVLADSIAREYGISKIFYAYAKKYMRFGIKNGQKRAKDYTPLELFERTEDVVLRPVAINKKADTGRVERMIYNKLVEWETRYEDMAQYYRQSIHDTIEFFNKVSANKQWSYRHGEIDIAVPELLAEEFLPPSAQFARALMSDKADRVRQLRNERYKKRSREIEAWLKKEKEKQEKQEKNKKQP